MTKPLSTSLTALTYFNCPEGREAMAELRKQESEESEPDARKSTPYTLRLRDGQWIAHALAFDLVGADADKEQAVAQLKLCLGAQIAYARGANCFFPAPVEYWMPPYQFMNLPTTEELAAYKFTPVTESRGAMTAQQFARVWEGDNPGKRADWCWDEFAVALSAHNTAELRAALEAEKKRLVDECVRGRAKDKQIRNLEERLRSQGAGQWIEEAAKEIVYKIRRNFYPEDVTVFAEIILKHAPVEGAGRWEAALRKYGWHKEGCSKHCRACELSVPTPCNCGFDEVLAGLASPPEPCESCHLPLDGPRGQNCELDGHTFKRGGFTKLASPPEGQP